MTEAEWVASIEPLKMLKAARARFSHRKLRLLAVACARLIQPLLPDHRSHRAIDTAERFAEGRATSAELMSAEKAAELAHKEAFQKLGKSASCLEWAAAYTCAPVAFKAAEATGWMSATGRMFPEATPANHVVQAALVRDIFGNPFRPVPIDPAWLSGPAVALAYMMYEKGSFDRMPELAEALGEASCTNQEILDHCRGSEPHVRGCWVIDLLLGKA